MFTRDKGLLNVDRTCFVGPAVETKFIGGYGYG